MANEEYLALRFLDGRVIVVGRAWPELDHGRPCYFCTTYPPFSQKYFMADATEEAVADWFTKEVGAEALVLGVWTPLPTELEDEP